MKPTFITYMNSTIKYVTKCLEFTSIRLYNFTKDKTVKIKGYKSSIHYVKYV